MTRYLIFAGQHYYPSGGMDDLEYRCDTFDQARTWLAGTCSDTTHHDAVPQHRRRYGYGVFETGLSALPDPQKIIDVPGRRAWIEFHWTYDWAQIFDLETGERTEVCFHQRSPFPLYGDHHHEPPSIVEPWDPNDRSAMIEPPLAVPPEGMMGGFLTPGTFNMGDGVTLEVLDLLDQEADDGAD